MMRFFCFSSLLIILGCRCFAQDDLFGKIKVTETHKGWILGANGNFDLPAADMAKSFGASFRVGPSVHYKTTSNWIFGVKADFILGSDIRVDSFLNNLKDKYGTFIAQNGARGGINSDERGYLIGLQAGKIFTTSKKSKDNGIQALTTVGFIQHKILINNPNGVMSLRPEYLKGYDRLTNGLFVEEIIEYVYFSKNGLVNFHIGPDVMFGFTQDRRDYLYDVMRPDAKQRLDVLFGIRGGWNFCRFKRKSEELVF